MHLGLGPMVNDVPVDLLNLRILYSYGEDFRVLLEYMQSREKSLYERVGLKRHQEHNDDSKSPGFDDTAGYF